MKMNSTISCEVQLQKKLKTLNVLIVDNEQMGSAIGKTVEQLGHSVVVAECYKKAFQKTAETKFDLILWDVNLSGGNGIDLIPEIRKKSVEDVNIVAMTGASTIEIEQKIRLPGVIYYMIKPFRLDELRSIINHLSKRKLKLCQ
jgi:DNA-binding response OmpR family regulator